MVHNRSFVIRIALLGAVMMILVIGGSTIGDDAHTVVPLLALLAICEFGFIISLVGVVIGFRNHQDATGPTRYIAITGCLVLAILFALKGLALWPM